MASSTTIYDDSWDCPHHPAAEEVWQESDCYWFYDANTRVGGFHRIGQTPHANTGSKGIFVFALDGDRYVSGNDAVALKPVDRWSTGHRVGGHSAEWLGDKRLRYTWEEPDSSGDLEFYESFHAPYNWPVPAGASRDDFTLGMNADGHLECSGRLKGAVRIGSKTYAIDALAHRDRSWGHRNPKLFDMTRYRMFSGTAGPELSFASFRLHLATGVSWSTGVVVRDGVKETVTHLRCQVTFDEDGLSPVGSTAYLTLGSGEILRLEARTLQGRGSGASSDNIQELPYNGKVGFLDLEMGANALRGSYTPTADDVTLIQMVRRGDTRLEKSRDYTV